MEEDNVNSPETKTNDSDLDQKSYINDSDLDQKSYVAEASKFIQDTPLDKMHEIAEAARLKKLMEPPKWVFPEDI